MMLARTISVLMGLASCGILACKSDGQVPTTKPGSSQIEWVAPAKLKPGPVRRDQLSVEQLERIKKLQQTFSEVDPTSLDKWVDDFKRDADPDREIRIYDGMAEAYSGYCAGKSLTREARQDVFQVVLLRSGAPDAEVLSRLTLVKLSLDDARAILKLYRASPAPITVSPTTSGP